jgi:hypothetical protein
LPLLDLFRRLNPEKATTERETAVRAVLREAGTNFTEKKNR